MAASVAGLMALWGASHAGAVELVPGGAAFEAEPASVGGPEDLQRRGRQDPGAGAPLFTMAFTPRGGFGLLTGADEPFEGPRLTLDLGAGVELGDRLDRLALAGGPSPGSSAREVRNGLVVGGALRWDHWSLGGSLSRASLLGAEADLLGASVGYGPFTARLSYGEVQRPSQPDGGLWVLSTDLAAWSWLSVEGDLALQTKPEAEPETVGRVGLKLSF